MAGTIDFVAANVRSVLQSLVARRDPLRLQVTLRGPVIALSERAVVCVADGRVHLVRTADRFGVDAMTRILLADGGSIEVLAESSSARSVTAPTLETLLAEGEARAQQIRTPLAPLGGLVGVLCADPDQRAAQTRSIPDAADQVMRLADGRRFVAQLLADSPYDEVLTARILAKLYAVGILVAVEPSRAAAVAMVAPSQAEGTSDEWVMPTRGWGDTAELPGEDDLEVEGPEVTGDISGWLSTGSAPPPLMSDDAFAKAFVSEGSEPTGPTFLSPRAAAVALEQGFVPEERSEDLLHTALGDSEAPTDAVGLVDRPKGPRSRLVAAVVLVLIVMLGGLLATGAGFFDQEATVDKKPDGSDAVMMAPEMLAPEPDLTDEPESDLVGPAPDALRRTIAPRDAPAAVRDAEALWEARQYGEAARVLQRLRRTRKNDSSVFVLSGMVFVDTGRLDLANAMANRALQLNRRSFRAWVLKGSVQQFKDRPRRALAAYRRALKLGPDHAMSDELRAVIEQLEQEVDR